MIDTVKASFPAVELRNGLVENLDHPGAIAGSSWYLQPDRTVHYNGELQKKARFIRRKGGRVGALTAYSTDGLIDGFHVSLPNHFFTTGGRLFSGQTELSDSLRLVRSHLGEICEPPLISDCRFTRVDLSLQFQVPGIPPAAFFTSLRHARHPGVHSGAEEWSVCSRESGLNFKGSGMTVKLYDKGMEMFSNPSPVVRIEIQLKGAPLKRLLGGEPNGYPTELNFEECYRVYREQLLRFPTVKHLPLQDVQSLRQLTPFLLSSYEASEIKLSDGRTPMEWVEELPLSRQTLSSIRQEMVAAQLEGVGISFSELLPETWPPPCMVNRVLPLNVVGG
tara:strand:- start:550 stop:1554 length:1005 start_codon:yes stop_codon:yes gene_type:complete